MKNFYHDDKHLMILRIIYIFGIVLWLSIVVYIKLLPCDDIYEWGLVLLPIILFIIAFVSIDRINEHVENFNFNYSLLTISLAVVVPLLGWMASKYKGDKKAFMKMCILAIFFSMLATLDVWVSGDNLCIVKHTKSILQTIGVSLILIAIYKFFLDTTPNSLQHNVSNTIFSTD